MSASVLYMTMSLDGFIAAPNDGPGNGLGDNGERLHAWYGEWHDTPGGFTPEGASGQVYAEGMASGAVLVGRNTFEYANRWHGEHHNGVPIFVPTRGEAPDHDYPLVHYVTDGVESAMAQAKEAAGDATVMVHGADLAQSLLRAQVLDEIEIHLVPIVLGGGRSLFGDVAVDLELTRVLEAPGVTHLHYRVQS